MVKTYNRLSFHSHTFCVWREVHSAETATMKVNFTSQSGSQYIFTPEGLYRISNHWGRVANCHWRLIPLTTYKNQHNTVAYANWSDFYPNDDTSKLFFIKKDSVSGEVNFYHRNTVENHAEVVLRNAKDTAKIIRIINEMMAQDQWAKYLNYSNLEKLRGEIIDKLIHSTKTFVEIKKDYL